MVVDMKYFTRVIQRLIPIIFSLILLYFGLKLALFYLPFLIAFVLSLLIEPAIRFLMKQLKLKRKTSSIVVFVLVLSILIGLITWAVMTLVSEASNLLNNLNGYIENASSLIQNLSSMLDVSYLKVPEAVVDSLQGVALDTVGQVSEWAKNLLVRTLDTLTQIPTMVFCIIISFLALYFICTDKVYMIDQMEHHLPRSWVKKLGSHIKAISQSLRRIFKSRGSACCDFVCYFCHRSYSF